MNQQAHLFSCLLSLLVDPYRKWYFLKFFLNMIMKFAQKRRLLIALYVLQSSKSLFFFGFIQHPISKVKSLPLRKIRNSCFEKLVNYIAVHSKIHIRGMLWKQKCITMTRFICKASGVCSKRCKFRLVKTIKTTDD